MNAPDKIYIHIGPHLGLMQANKVPVGAPGEEEYIRKDAILEWANRQKEATEGLIKEHPKDDSLWAEMHWYEQLIKHIESL